MEKLIFVSLKKSQETRSVMKKRNWSFLLLFTVLAMLSSCTGNLKEFNNQVDQSMTEAESIVHYYDQAVVNSMKTGSYYEILEQSQQASTALSRISDQLKIINVPMNASEIKQSAIEYVESLNKLIKVQEEYASLSDSTTVQEADEMDSKVNNVYDEVTHKRERLLEVQNKLIEKTESAK